MSLQTALGHAIAARFVSLALMVVGFAALSRLLPPEAFGHFAVAMAVFGLAQVVVVFGQQQLVVSRPAEHSTDELSAAAGVSLIIAAVLSASGLLVATTRAAGTIDAQLAAALIPLSLALLLGPFRLGPEARLQRALRFGLISVASVLGTAVDVAVAIGLALAGAGALALACGVLAAQLAVTALMILGTKPDLRARPRLRAGLRRWAEVRGWGRRMTLIQILPKVSDLAMIGGLSALQGAAALGLFNRAQTIHRMLDKALLSGIVPVILPAFSGALRDGVDPGRLYRLKLEYLSALCWPCFALIALLADNLVAVLLGPGWQHAVPIVTILSLMGIGLPATKMSQKFFVALEETGAFLRIEATREAVRVPLALGGALVSVEAFALAFVAGNWIKAVGVTRFLTRRTGGPEGGHVRIALRAAGLTAVTLLGPLAVVSADLSARATLLCSLPLAVTGWLAAAAVLRHPVMDELSVVLGRLRRMRRPPPGP